MKSYKLILIVCVVVMGYAGVSYAAWTDSLKLKTLLSTGEFDVAFTNCELKTDRYKKDEVSEELDWIDVKIVNNVLVISGEVTPGFKGKVKYSLINNSTLPVKYLPEGKKQTVEYGGMTITLQEKEIVLEPGESMPKDNGWGQFQIEFDQPNKYEFDFSKRYEYNFYLPFVQYNLTSGGGWNQDLKIHVDITVVEEPIESELELIDENAVKPQTLDVPEIETSPIAEPSINTDQTETDNAPVDTDLIDTVQTDVTPISSEEESAIDENVKGDSAGTEIQTETENIDLVDHARTDDELKENTEGGEE